MALISFEQQTHKAIGTYFQLLINCVPHKNRLKFGRILEEVGLSNGAVLGGDIGKAVFSDFKQVLYNTQDQLIPDIILTFSKAVRLSGLGILGYAIINSENIGKALEVSSRFSSLAYSNFDFEVCRHKDIASIRLLDHLPSRLEREDFICSKYNMLSRMLPASTNLSKMYIQLDYPRPSYQDSYWRFFKSSMQFDTSHLCINFPAEWLETAVSGADRELYLLCEAQCAEMLAEHGLVSNVIQKVRRIMLRPDGIGIGLEAVASKLNMSPRNLREKLYQSGTTYKQVVVDVRMSLAKQYLLESYMSIKEISYRLNYAQPNSFGRAFKRTYGISPENMRLQSVTY